jgi:hypothetical protein
MKFGERLTAINAQHILCRKDIQAAAPHPFH